MRLRSAIRLGIGLLLVVALAGCAQQRTVQSAAKPARSGGPDFSRDDAANFAAAQIAEKLLADVDPLPGFAGARIVSYGIEVDVVGAPSNAMRAAVARDAQRYQGIPIPIRYRRVVNSQKDLQALQDRITADCEDWAKQGIQLSTWGIDIVSNTVQIGLWDYSITAQTLLLARYGNRISVIPYDFRMANM